MSMCTCATLSVCVCVSLRTLHVCTPTISTTNPLAHRVFSISSLCLVNPDKWQVINATTPANLFHALRRQCHRDFRKPLVMMSPKRLLRLPEARSPFADFEEGTRFKRVIPEVDPEIWSGAGKEGTTAGTKKKDHSFIVKAEAPHIKKLIFCSGQVYYDLVEARSKREIKDVAIVRIEQISPFP